MARTRGSGPSRDGNRPAPRPRKAAAPAADPDAQFTVRCPHCGTTYHVPLRYAGKPARCSHCGAHATLPEAPPVRRTTPTRTTKRTRAAAGNGDAAERGPEVRIGAIGRGHAGKTALFQ